MASTYFYDKISNIIFLTWNWWLLGKEWNIIPFLTANKVKNIIEWINNEVKVDWWILKKIKSIYDLLMIWIDKVTLTNIDGLKEELEWFGSWTIFVNLDKAKFIKLNSLELFEKIYNHYWKNWKKRNFDEKKKIFDNYTVLSLNWTILWWYSLSNYEIKWKKWKMLECIYASTEWSWIWTIILEKIKEENIVFAYSKSWFFEKVWFTKLDNEQSETWADLYIYVKSCNLQTK